MLSLVIAITRSRRPGALPSVIRCDSDERAMAAAALIAMSAAGRPAIAVIGSNGEYQWQVSPFSSQEPVAVKGAA